MMHLLWQCFSACATCSMRSTRLKTSSGPAHRNASDSVPRNSVRCIAWRRHGISLPCFGPCPTSQTGDATAELGDGRRRGLKEGAPVSSGAFVDCSRVRRSDARLLDQSTCQ